MLTRSVHTIYGHESRFLSTAEGPESSAGGKPDRIRTSEAKLPDGAPDWSPKQLGSGSPGTEKARVRKSWRLALLTRHTLGTVT